MAAGAKGIVVGGRAVIKVSGVMLEEIVRSTRGDMEPFDRGFHVGGSEDTLLVVSDEPLLPFETKSVTGVKLDSADA